MKKIRVLRIIARLNIGGPAIHAVLLTDGLDKNRFESLLICGSLSSNEGDMQYFASANNVFPKIIPEMQREIGFLSDFRSVLKIYAIIADYKPDIVHTHTAKAGFLGRLAALFYGLRHPFAKKIILVHTFHGHIFQGYFGRAKSLIFISVEKVLSLFTKKIITVSDIVKVELASLGACPEKKIEVIALGFDLDKFLHIPARVVGDVRQELVIGIVGRLVPIKNHYLFLEAASVMIRKYGGFKLRFTVVGDGDLRRQLEECARKLMIDKHVDFLGWQKHLEGIYSRLDIVVLTSNNEGTPVSLIEAMASGRPVVATDAGGVRNLLGVPILFSDENGSFQIMERGILVRKNDAESFARAVIFLLKDPVLMNKMSISARAFVGRQYAKDRLFRDIEKLYNNLLHAKLDVGAR